MFHQVADLFHDLDMGMLPISVLFPYLPIPPHWRRDRCAHKSTAHASTRANHRALPEALRWMRGVSGVAAGQLQLLQLSSP